jgi:hypothetical protein
VGKQAGLELSRRSLFIVTLALVIDGGTMFFMGLAMGLVFTSGPPDAASDSDGRLGVIIFIACTLYLVLSILALCLCWWRMSNSRFWAFFIAGLALLSLGAAGYWSYESVIAGFSGLASNALFFLVSLGLNGYVIQAVLRTYLRPKQLEAGSILNPPL